MIPEDNLIPDQKVVPGRRIFIYLIVFIILSLVVFVAWGSYRYYQATHINGTSACSPKGVCVVYPKSDADKWCPVTFNSSNCDNKCGDAKNRCSK